MLPQNASQPPKDFFKNTFCIFNEVPLSVIEDRKPDFKSASGSRYYYTQEGMFRLSNHWGKLANSKWRLIAMEPPSSAKIKLGFAKWEAFYPDNDLDKLYYIEVDFQTHTANYYHKEGVEFNAENVIFRTYNETQKRLKNIRNILTLTNWAKPYAQDIEVLRRKIIHELIHTDKTLAVIKSEADKV